MSTIVDSLNFHNNYKNNLILININQDILIIATHIIFLLPTP